MYVTHVGAKEGERVPFTENGTEVTFGIEGNSFTVDVEKLQQDSQVSFDIMQDETGTLGTEGDGTPLRSPSPRRNTRRWRTGKTTP